MPTTPLFPPERRDHPRGWVFLENISEISTQGGVRSYKSHVPSVLKTAFFALLLALVTPARGEWPGVPYSTVRAYAWPLDQNEETVVLPGLKLRRGMLKNSGAVLTADQRARLLTAQQRRAGARPQAACYVPHNAFVFFDAKGKPVAFLELCFDCLGSRTFPDDPNCDPDFIALAKIFAEQKLPFGRFKSFAEFQAATAPILGQ